MEEGWILGGNDSGLVFLGAGSFGRGEEATDVGEGDDIRGRGKGRLRY